MKPERINAVIAEWMGWKRIDSERFNDWVHPNAPGWHSRTPNYLNNWNATHDAVNRLNGIERGEFLIQIDAITSRRSKEWLPARIATATRDEWCEALLRTICKWEEE